MCFIVTSSLQGSVDFSTQIIPALLHKVRRNLVNVLFGHTIHPFTNLPWNLPWCCLVSSYNTMFIVCCMCDVGSSGKEWGDVFQCRLKCASPVHIWKICRTGLCCIVFCCIDVIERLTLISILSTDKRPWVKCFSNIRSKTSTWVLP